MSANDTLELLAKQWYTLNDLMKLTNLGRNSALKIRKEIKPTTQTAATIKSTVVTV